MVNSCLDFGMFYSGGLLPIECWNIIYKKVHNSYMKDLCEEIYLRTENFRFKSYDNFAFVSDWGDDADELYFSYEMVYYDFLDELEVKHNELFNDLSIRKDVVLNKYNLNKQIKRGREECDRCLKLYKNYTLKGQEDYNSKLKHYKDRIYYRFFNIVVGYENKLKNKSIRKIMNDVDMVYYDISGYEFSDDDF